LEISAEEAEERRKTIIRKVQEKYKELAKKELRYELSMLGDPTYHRMKHKVLPTPSRHRVHKNHTASRNHTAPSYP
jgi:hypothetical protein